MDALVGLSEEDRKSALDRFRLLQPHLVQHCPLRQVDAEAGIAFRTAQRWVAQYQRFRFAVVGAGAALQDCLRQIAPLFGVPFCDGVVGGLGAKQEGADQ
jgi:hypothetical protein